MTDNRALHIIRLLELQLKYQEDIYKVLLDIKNDVAQILVGVNNIVSISAASLTALNNVITLLTNANNNLNNVSSILTDIYNELLIVKADLDSLLLQGTDTYVLLSNVLTEIQSLNTSSQVFFAEIRKQEDDVASSGDSGIQALSVRQSTPSITTSDDGDYQSFKTDDIGLLYVNSYRTLPFNADYLEQSNPDVNGNFQTITYKRGGASGITVRTISLTYDSSGNVLTYLES